MKYEKMYIRSLNAADLDSILELQENTLLGLKDSSVLRRNSPEILLQAVSERNIALGVFIDKKLIAIGIAVDPVPPETDLRVNLQKFSVGKAMDLKLCIVREGFRGNGLQAAFINILEKLAYIRAKPISAHLFLLITLTVSGMYYLRVMNMTIRNLCMAVFSAMFMLKN